MKRVIKNERCTNLMGGGAEKKQPPVQLLFIPGGLRSAIDHAPFLGSHGMQKTAPTTVDNLSVLFPVP